MIHRFPIGTQYKPVGKHTKVTTVIDQLTLTDSKGEILRVSYLTQHEFLGQTITNHDVCDTTIARGLLPEYQYLLK